MVKKRKSSGVLVHVRTDEYYPYYSLTDVEDFKDWQYKPPTVKLTKRDLAMHKRIVRLSDRHQKWLEGLSKLQSH